MEVQQLWMAKILPPNGGITIIVISSSIAKQIHIYGLPSSMI
jgi:hypothetical protein